MWDSALRFAHLLHPVVPLRTGGRYRKSRRQAACDLQKQRFTLVELLVVIAIIAMLASMLLPSLRAARDRAKSISCQSNLRSQGMALHMYVEDFADKLPLAWHSPLDAELYGSQWDPYGGVNPSTALYPYLENLQVFICPDFAIVPNLGLTYANQVPPLLEVINGHLSLTHSQYRPNPYLGCRGYGPGSYPGWNMNMDPPNLWQIGRIDQPSEKVFQFDGLRTHSPYGSSPREAAEDYWLNTLGDGDRSNPFNYGPAGGYYGAPNMGKWHLEGTNVVYLDGHVTWEPATSDVTFYDLDDSHWSFP